MYIFINMQQYFPVNVQNDPTRRIGQNDSFKMKKNIFKDMKKGINDEIKVNNYRDNIFNTDYDKMSFVNSEVVEKDKKIQELEFKIQQNEIENQSLHNKMESINKYIEENKELKKKIREEYEKNKEITLLNNKIQLLEKQKKEDDNIIMDLKGKVDYLDKEEGIDLDLMNIKNRGTEGGEEGIDNLHYNEIFKKTLEEQGKKKIYRNDHLKQLILRHIKSIPSEKVDDIFIDMKIREDVKITKELITSIIIQLNK